MLRTNLGYKQLNFGYNTKMEVYPNLSSHIPKLSDIWLRGKKNENNI